MECLKNLLKPTSVVRGGLAGLTTSLCLNLGCPSGATKQISENSKHEIAEAISPSNYVDTTNAIDFDIARKSIEESNSNAEVDFNSQTGDNLPNEENKDSIHETLRKNSKMLENEDVNEAIERGDKESIESELLDSINDKILELILNGLIMSIGYILGRFNYEKKTGIRDFFKKKKGQARDFLKKRKNDMVNTEVDETQLLNGKRSQELFQILQEINKNREKNGKDVTKITKKLLDSIILLMNNFEQTVEELRRVEAAFKGKMDTNNELYYEISKGENLDEMNVKELLDITKCRQNVLCFQYRIDELITEHYEYIVRLWDQFGEIGIIMGDNFHINSDDDVFRKIFKIRFDENYDGIYGIPSSEDLLTQKTLYDIAEAGKNDKVYSEELKIVEGKDGWPKFQIPFGEKFLWGLGESTVIATTRDRNPIFRLRINKRELNKKIKTNHGGNYNRVLFDNGKVYLTGDDVKRPINITKYLY